MDTNRAGDNRRDQVDRLAIAAKTDPAIMPALWEAVERFIGYHARRRYILTGGAGGCEIADYKQAGFLALSEAVKHFEPEKGSFVTLLAFYLKTEFNEAAGIRTEKKDALQYASSLNALVDEDDPDSEKIYQIPDQAAEDAFRDAEDSVFTEDLHRALCKAIDDLPVAKREIIKGRYFKGETQKEIAQRRGVSASAVAEAERWALRRLRETAKQSGLDQFVEERTPYYWHYSIDFMRRTGNSPVEAITFVRERLRKEFTVL